ncbi:MAG TPA: hypothetical protein VMT91_09260 [Anaerolineales bacterium]|nr:hypothetical protein [Anaerolineales bacterium]
MDKKRKISKGWKLVMQGLPFAGTLGASFLPLQRLGQQFLVLIVLLWLQVFFIFECFLINK